MRALREDRETMKNYQGLMRRAEEIGDPKPEHTYALGEEDRENPACLTPKTLDPPEFHKGNL